ncbi:hypothetical protein POVWA2_024060 [Plasmodium ovale wallikeri]|uniref:Uncharacterized protein n=1 Tax=Plasmodium ovale wallikeri TaxID=864142 RepID=A0A1A8YUW5_PLAOA|nr:hypothetical protein POVWA1_024170 [Plasmodium ovale wallikeri]SBT35237.1 hypothetical protein POVWA2_024060 [Plasmodium ovale wallikeri]
MRLRWGDAEHESRKSPEISFNFTVPKRVGASYALPVFTHSGHPHILWPFYNLLKRKPLERPPSSRKNGNN